MSQEKKQNPHLFKPGERRIGRAKGTQNKITKDLKEMILKALDKAGGVDYLLQQTQDNPKAFLALLGRVLPMQIKGAGENGEIEIKTSVRVIDSSKPAPVTIDQ